MKSMITACAALLIGSTAVVGYAAPVAAGPAAGGVVSRVPLAPSCAPGFKYSVKEQFGGPTGHLWFICKTATISCPGTISAMVQESGNKFMFVFRCLIPTANVAPGCPTGFTKGNMGLAANYTTCQSPMLSCPANFNKMSATNALTPDKHEVTFEYQCYRPG